MNHEELKSKLFDYYDGALIKEEEQEISLHLSECSQCQAEIEQWEKLKEALFKQEIPPLPAHFAENVMAKIHNMPAPNTYPVFASHPSQEWIGLRNWLDALGIPKWERAFAGFVLGIGILYSLMAFYPQAREDFNALWADFSNGGTTPVLFVEDEPGLDELL